MHFNRAGRQFFFITIALEGRPKALSRLIDTASRPVLLPGGEAAKAVLVAMHGVFPCATVSDYVIMPDHIHFLLIVDYSRDPAFSPLWASHRLMDAVELAWQQNGGDAPKPPAELLARAIATARQNRGQLTIANTPFLQQGFGCGSHHAPTIQQGFGGGSHHAPAIQQGFGGGSLPSLPRWARHCYIELSFDSRQLKTIRRYIRLNPARALWKAHHPDRFIRFADIRHPVLDPARQWDAMGNLTLLGSPFLHHVRLTMRKTAEEHAAEIAETIERAKRGVVPVCGFISPGEKELLRRLKAEPAARFIKTVPFALPLRYDPSAEDSRELAADRMLILSGFPQGTPDSRENLRERCNTMNNFAAALCARAQTLGDT